jgi:hypothetical protein
MKRLKYSFCAAAQLAPRPPNATTPPYGWGFFIVLISNHQVQGQIFGAWNLLGCFTRRIELSAIRSSNEKAAS